MANGTRPIVFLLPEKHDDNNCTGRTSTTPALYDAQLIDVVGVEQYPPHPCDIKAEISKEPAVQKDGGIEGYTVR